MKFFFLHDNFDVEGQILAGQLRSDFYAENEEMGGARIRRIVGRKEFLLK